MASIRLVQCIFIDFCALTIITEHSRSLFHNTVFIRVPCRHGQWPQTSSTVVSVPNTTHGGCPSLSQGTEINSTKFLQRASRQRGAPPAKVETTIEASGGKWRQSRHQWDATVATCYCTLGLVVLPADPPSKTNTITGKRKKGLP